MDFDAVMAHEPDGISCVGQTCEVCRLQMAIERCLIGEISELKIPTGGLSEPRKRRKIYGGNRRRRWR